MLDLASIPTRLPDQSLSETEMKRQYGSIQNFYLATVRNISQSYNRFGTADFNKISNGVGGGEVAQILDNFNYFQGVQQNTSFAYLSETVDQAGKVVEMATPYMPGQDIATILLFMQGQFMGVASSATPRVNVINPDMKNQLTDKLKMVQVKKKFGDLLDKIRDQTGIDFKSPANPNQDVEGIVKELQMSFTTDLLKDANIILDYVRNRSMSIADYLRSEMDVLVGRRCAMYVQNNGMIENIEPDRYFYVSGKDHDYGKYDFARGFVRRIHKDDILSRYSDELTESQIHEIKQGNFTSSPIFAQFQDRYNFSFVDGSNEYYTVVTCFWKSTLDSRYKIVEDEDGKKVIRLRSKNTKKGLPVEVIRKATVIANMYVVDYGVHDVVEDPNQQGNKIFPIVSFQPNTFNGFNQSLVDRLKNTQKELDAINQRIRENYTQDIGTILVFNGKKFKNGITPEEIYEQLRRTRITVSTESGIDEDYTNNQPMIQREDVSLMREIQNYLSLKQAFKQQVAEIANVSSIIMGSQQEYVGLRTQQNSQALASNSVQYFYQGVMQCWADAAMIAVEYVRKDIVKNPSKQVYLNLLGQQGVERIVAMSKEPYWRFQAYISTSDIIDPQRKQRLLSMLDNLAATGQIDIVDWLNVEDAKTMTELKDYAKYSVNKKNEMNRIAQMIGNATQVQQSEIAAQGQVAAKQAEQKGKSQQQSSKNVTDLSQTMLKQGYSMEDVTSLIQGAAQGGGQGQQQQMPMEQPMEQ